MSKWSRPGCEYFHNIILNYGPGIPFYGPTNMWKIIHLNTCSYSVYKINRIVLFNLVSIMDCCHSGLLHSPSHVDIDSIELGRCKNYKLIQETFKFFRERMLYPAYYSYWGRVRCCSTGSIIGACAFNRSEEMNLATTTVLTLSRALCYSLVWTCTPLCWARQKKVVYYKCLF